MPHRATVAAGLHRGTARHPSGCGGGHADGRCHCLRHAAPGAETSAASSGSGLDRWAQPGNPASVSAS